eukprot:s514_g16.t1
MAHTSYRWANPSGTGLTSVTWTFTLMTLDMTESTPIRRCVCAARAYKVWEEVKANLAEARLPVSVEKTAWVCNNRAPQNALEKYLQENDPKVKDVYKRLGPGFGW